MGVWLESRIEFRFEFLKIKCSFDAILCEIDGFILAESFLFYTYVQFLNRRFLQGVEGEVLYTHFW